MARMEKECARGHHYKPDADSDECPFCAQVEMGYRPKRTNPIYPEDIAKAGAPGARQAAAAPGAPSTPGAFARTRTVPMYETDVDEPVAGWLVATAGPLRGKDFRVPMGRSSFGRDAECRICILGDPTISSKQGFINYSRNRRFTITPGEGSSLLYLNGSEVLSPLDLQAFDVIEMGATKMAFVPFCGDRFDWSGEAK